MVTRDLIDNITAIMTRPDLEGQPAEVRGDIVARAEDERAVLAGQLRLARDEGGEDPLLAVVERVRDRMLAADRDLRLLLAYAREFAEPRPYRLPQAGATVSTARSLHGSPPPGRRRTTASGARASRRRARHANCSGRCCRRRAGSHRSGRCQSVRGPCLTDSPVSYKPSSTMAPPSATRSRTCGT